MPMYLPFKSLLAEQNTKKKYCSDDQYIYFTPQTLILFYFLPQYKYKESFEKMKGQMIGSHGLEDINLSHSVHASLLQSDVSTRA